jgi:hypothetical protein
VTPSGGPQLIALVSDLKEGTEIICVGPGVALRETPAANGVILTFLKRDDRLTFLAWSDSWVHVRFGDAEGYADPRLLRYDPNSVPAASPTPTSTSTSTPVPAPESSPTPGLSAETAAPTPAEAPPTVTAYADAWSSKNPLEKLAGIPTWFLAVLVVGLAVLLVLWLLRRRRR